MRYFVVAYDGQKYGPADLQTLLGWQKEGRIAPDTILETADGKQFAASAILSGNIRPEPVATQPLEPPAPYAGYMRVNQFGSPVAVGQSSGQTEATVAWIFFGLSALGGCTCLVPAILSLPAAIMGRIAYGKGYRGGQVVMILSIILGVLQLLFLFSAFRSVG